MNILLDLSPPQTRPEHFVDLTNKVAPSSLPNVGTCHRVILLLTFIDPRAICYLTPFSVAGFPNKNMLK